MVDTTTTQLTLVEVYIITLRNGSVAYFTSHDANIIYDGYEYQAIPIKRTNINYHIDLQVDKVDISFGLIGITVGTDTLSIPTIIRRGYLRNAHVEIYLIDYIALDSDTLLFEGWVTGDITFNAGVTTLGCGSLLDKLQDKFPKLIYSELCNHQLFSSYCSLVKATYQENGTAGTGTTTQLIYAPIFLFSAHAEGYWNKGEIKMTSGANNAISKSIIVHGDGYVKTMIPFPESIVIGIDTLSAWPGCDKTGATCADKFLDSNYANFLGFEYIPKPETLYA